MDQKDGSDLVLTQQRLLNGVSYESLPETSIAVARTYKGNPFQKNTYSSSNNSAICDINTGAEFINPRRSYLSIKVKITTAAGKANFGRGGVTNLIKRVVITSRSGVELSRTEEYNVLMAKVFRYGCPTEHVEQFGQLMGFSNVAADLGSDGDGGQLDTTGRVFLIPLPMLSPFFAGDGKSLIPPQLGAGLRIQLTFETDKRALVSATAMVYEIEEINVMTNVVTLIDSWQKHINEESSRDGLTYSYTDWHTTQSNAGSGSTRTNIEVRKAVGRALMCFTVSQSSADTVTSDNMKSDEYKFSNVMYRLGNLYPTNNPVTTASEMYFMSQSAWDRDVVDCNRPNSVSLKTFTDSAPLVVAATGTLDGDGITSCSLERNDVSINGVLNIGGLPTNNSRTLSVDMTSSVPAPLTGTVTYLFMRYFKVVKAYLDNVAIAE